MSEMRQVDVGSLKKGSYVMIDDHPCIVTDISTAKTGKHGATKAHVTATGIFDKKRREFIGPTDTKVFQPIVEKRAGQVLSIAGDNAQLMDVETFETLNARIPEDLQGQLIEGGQVVYWKVGEQVMVMELKG